MADAPADTIATSRPARKINPPARLIDGNNSAIPALSSHREGIAAHAAAQKKTGNDNASANASSSSAISNSSAPSAQLHAVPNPSTAEPTTPALPSTPGPAAPSDKSTKKRATVEEADSGDKGIAPVPKRGRKSQGAYYWIYSMYESG